MMGRSDEIPLDASFRYCNFGENIFSFSDSDLAKGPFFEVKVGPIYLVLCHDISNCCSCTGCDCWSPRGPESIARGVHACNKEQFEDDIL